MYTDIPQDPVILLSFINTQLRDNFHDLTELCASYMVDKDSIVGKLEQIDYYYDIEKNQFI